MRTTLALPEGPALAGRASPTPVAAGQLTVSATVTVRYRLAP
jgi:uncharacterized protein YggE